MAKNVTVKDRGYKRLVRQINALDGWQATVGVHSQQADSGRGIDNVGLMVIHEFGVGRIPERAPLRTAFDKNRRKYERFLASGARLIASGKSSPKQIAGIVGELAVADVVNGINAGLPPPNAPSTIDRKGSSTPLVDTGQLKASIKSVVRKR